MSLDSSRAGEILTQANDTFGGQVARVRQDEVTADMVKPGCNMAPCSMTMQVQDKAIRLKARQAEEGLGQYASKSAG
jgi:hypothetical protein